VVGDPKAIGDRRAVAVVATQQLDDPRRRSELGGGSERPPIVKGVHEPHTQIGAQGMSGAGHGVLFVPGQSGTVGLDGHAHESTFSHRAPSVLAVGAELGDRVLLTHRRAVKT
jgi:hypothetical protein